MIAACLALLAPGAAAAKARVSIYPRAPEARSFASSPDGWSEASATQGLCVEALSCPALVNTFVPADGAAGDGFLRTAVGPSVLGFGAASAGRWLSPAFTYRGADGRRPDIVKFAMSRRADVAALLQVAEADAHYSVQLQDESTGQALSVITLETLSGSAGWERIPSISISPSQLARGHSYRIAITTVYENGIAAIPAATADYDDVALKARRRATPSPNVRE